MSIRLQRIIDTAIKIIRRIMQGGKKQQKKKQVKNKAQKHYKWC
jgi:hypothetical protein